MKFLPISRVVVECTTDSVVVGIGVGVVVNNLDNEGLFMIA